MPVMVAHFLTEFLYTVCGCYTGNFLIPLSLCSKIRSSLESHPRKVSHRARTPYPINRPIIAKLINLTNLTLSSELTEQYAGT